MKNISYLCASNYFCFMTTLTVPIHNIIADFIQGEDLPNYKNVQSEATSLNMLSLFSGCGGMDLGFEGGFICHRRSVGGNIDWIEREVTSDWVLLKKNRFNTIFANDILQEARAAWIDYMGRFGKEPQIYRFQSIVDLVKAHHAGEKVFPEGVDIVTGGFPCQDFSVAGKRKGFDSGKMHDGSRRNDDAPTEETRGKLYCWMKQVIDIVKPKVFIAENVKGLISLGEVKDIIQRDFSGAADEGYLVLDPQVLHAGDYGVPESRERVIFIGLRKSALRQDVLKTLESGNDVSELNPYPAPTHDHRRFDGEVVDGCHAAVSVGEIFASLPEPDMTSDLSQRHYSQAKYMGKHCQGQSEISLDKLGPTIRSEHHGNIEYRRLSAEHGGTKSDELLRGLVERRLTPRECALIQTFPPDYPFVTLKDGSTTRYNVSPSGAYKIIGNAVPPMLAYNIARRLQHLWPILFQHE